jgi:hypothetical protein
VLTGLKSTGADERPDLSLDVVCVSGLHVPAVIPLEIRFLEFTLGFDLSPGELAHFWEELVLKDG